MPVSVEWQVATMETKMSFFFNPPLLIILTVLTIKATLQHYFNKKMCCKSHFTLYFYQSIVLKPISDGRSGTSSVPGEGCMGFKFRANQISFTLPTTYHRCNLDVWALAQSREQAHSLPAARRGESWYSQLPCLMFRI